MWRQPGDQFDPETVAGGEPADCCVAAHEELPQTTATALVRAAYVGPLTSAEFTIAVLVGSHPMALAATYTKDRTDPAQDPNRLGPNARRPTSRDSAMHGWRRR